MTYTEWLLGGTPIGGMMALPKECRRRPTGSPTSPSTIAIATAALAASLGAKTCVPPTDIPGMGHFAVFADPQGATFAIYRE